jgi:CBS domain-containing protein
MTASAAIPHTLATARVVDSMTRGVICCRPDTPLREVAALMVRERVHAVYVFVTGPVDAEPELWGVVSDLDLVAAGRGDIDTLTAHDAAVEPLVTAEPDDPLDRAAQLLSEHGVSHLAVVDPYSRQPVGVLSTLDVARFSAGGARC